MEQKNQIKSVFDVLSSVNVRDKVEKKNNMDYISWANAWSMLKSQYPDAQRKVYEHDHTGFNYFTDGKTAYVKVGIIVGGLEHIDYLPIMDYRNNAIPIEKLTAVDVNKAIQRSTAKAIAMHGLGLQLWTGEDIPEMTAESPKEVKLIKLETKGVNWDNISKYAISNKSLGIEKIVQQISRKYIVTDEIKNKISKLIAQ
jgi:hypothetical protein